MTKRENWAPEFEKRYVRHEDELKWLYCELYHNDMRAYSYFTDMLYRAYEARPESLKNMDRAREEYPDWYRGHDLVGMLMYVNAFAGTLKGVKKKIDYITDCGVNYLHLMPLLESPKGRSDGGYAVSDFRKVQPELGADLALTETFLSIGIDELSVSPRSVLPLRQKVRETDVRVVREKVLADLMGDANTEI